MAGSCTKCDKGKQKPRLPLKTKILIAAQNFALKAVIGPKGTVRRRLINFLEPKAKAPSSKRISPTLTISTADFIVNSSRNLWFRRFVPTPLHDQSLPEKLPLLFYIHGGGFIFSGPNSKPFHHLCRHLAAGIPSVVISVNYRLAPEHRFPCQYDDCFDALKYIDSRENDAVLPPNVDTGNCFIIGDSAGGNIAHHVTVRARQRQDEFKNLKIAGLIALQPFFGGEKRTDSELRLSGTGNLSLKRTDWMWRSFLPKGANRDHQAVNVFCGGAEDKAEEAVGKIEFPATMVVMGGFDQLKDWQRKYSEGLRRCGKEVEVIEYPNAIHGFYVFPNLPEFSTLIKDIKAFVSKKFSFSKE